MSIREVKKVYKNLVANYEVSWDPSLKPLVNFENSHKLPIHRWYDYGEGFSPKLVESKIGNGVEFIFDPFVGSGTTCFKAGELRIPSKGLEINPFTYFIARVKTRRYTENDLEKFKRKIIEMKKAKFSPSIEKPKLSTIDGMFKDKDGKNHLSKVLMYREFIENVGSGKIRDLLKLGWLAVLEEVSNYRKGGNGLKKKYNDDRDIERSLFKEQYPKMVKDIQTRIHHRFYNEYEVPEIIRGNCFHLDKYLDDNSVDLSVFSPPYANCFDYFEIYKMELWLGGFVNSYEEMREMKRQALRSHVNLKMDYSDVSESPEELAILIENMDRRSLWNGDIPDMLRGYFHDMKKVLDKMFVKMVEGGRIEIVVSSSSYGNLVIPTDLLLASISEDLGYEVKEIKVARNIVTSSQQYNKLGSLNSLMRESVISICR